MCTDKNNDKNKMNVPPLSSTPVTVFLIAEKPLSLCRTLKFSDFQFVFLKTN